MEFWARDWRLSLDLSRAVDPRVAILEIPDIVNKKFRGKFVS
jgi:hypothetical protein